MKNKSVKLWILLTALFSCLTANAYDFEYEGLYYNILSETDRTVEVAYYKDYFGELTIPNEIFYNNYTYQVIAIGSDAFNRCTSLKSIIIPNSVILIGNCAFWGCTSLSSVIIPDSVTKVGNCAFWGCTALSSVIIPDSVTEIDYYTFWGCTALSSVTIPNSVTKIGACAFFECSRLIFLELPNSLKTIGFRAFSGSSIITINIPKSVETIEQDAFTDCKALTEINVEPDNQSYCSINGILYSKDVIQLIKCPMDYKHSSVKIPSPVALIEDRAFCCCYNITNITMPITVTTIGQSAFDSCENVKSIVLPNSLTTIKDWAFNCCRFSEITFGSALEYIGNAFGDCSISKIYCLQSIPPIFNGCFSRSVNKYATLYVPLGYGSVYKNVYPWSEIKNIKEYDFSGVGGITIDENFIVQIQNGEIIISGIADTEPVEIFDISGKTVYKGYDHAISNLAKGIYIIKTDNIIKKIQL